MSAASIVTIVILIGVNLAIYLLFYHLLQEERANTRVWQTVAEGAVANSQRAVEASGHMAQKMVVTTSETTLALIETMNNSTKIQADTLQGAVQMAWAPTAKIDSAQPPVPYMMPTMFGADLANTREQDSDYDPTDGFVAPTHVDAVVVGDEGVPTIVDGKFLGFGVDPVVDL